MFNASGAAAHPLIVTLERRDELSLEEKAVVETLPWRVRTFEAGEEIVRQNSRPAESCLMLEGLAACARSSADGARQITALYIPGNFVDLHCFLLKRIDHSVIAVAKCRAGFVSHEALKPITERFAHLTRLLWTIAEVDGAIQRNWIFQLGRRKAVQRLAHLVCEMFRRLEVVGLTSGQSFLFPVNQAEIGDMLGLSTVHINRSLQDLRARNLVSWDRPVVTIKDWPGLARFAEFDPTYLSFDREPR